MITVLYTREAYIQEKSNSYKKRNTNYIKKIFIILASERVVRSENFLMLHRSNYGSFLTLFEKKEKNLKITERGDDWETGGYDFSFGNFSFNIHCPRSSQRR